MKTRCFETQRPSGIGSASHVGSCRPSGIQRRPVPQWVSIQSVCKIALVNFRGEGKQPIDCRTPSVPPPIPGFQLACVQTLGDARLLTRAE